MIFNRKDGKNKKEVTKPDPRPTERVKYRDGNHVIVTYTPDGMGSFYEDRRPDPTDYEPGR